MGAVHHHGATAGWKAAARAIAAVLLVLALASAWAWWAQYERRALLSLPTGERSRIYSRNLDSLRLLCSNLAQAQPFESRCREQARFLAEFPECEADCRALLEPWLPKPSR